MAIFQAIPDKQKRVNIIGEGLILCPNLYKNIHIYLNIVVLSDNSIHKTVDYVDVSAITDTVCITEFSFGAGESAGVVVRWKYPISNCNQIFILIQITVNLSVSRFVYVFWAIFRKTKLILYVKYVIYISMYMEYFIAFLSDYVRLSGREEFFTNLHRNIQGILERSVVL